MTSHGAHLDARCGYDTTAGRPVDEVEDLLDSMTDAYFALCRDWRFTYVNRAAELLLGRLRDELVGAEIWTAFDDPSGVEFKHHYERAMAGEGVEFVARYAALESWYEVRAHPTAAGIAVYFRDITDRHLADEERERLLRATKRAEAKLAHAAMHDPLTGLPNRAQTVRWLNQHLSSRGGTDSLAVILVDLDRFKRVNDTYGHAEGDALLVESARRLSAAAPEGALVARLGGDEFAIGLTSGGFSGAQRVAHDLVEVFRRHCSVGRRRLVVTASAGIAVADARTTTCTLLRDADAALYRAKDEGRDRFAVYSEVLRRQIVRRLEIEADLRDALERGLLVSHYQPIFDATTGCPSGAEALVRWRHRGRMVRPDEFIPVAEESGLIVPLGERMLDQAVADARQLRVALGPAATTVWVNVSARQLEDRSFATRLLARLDSSEAMIGVEITERVLAPEGPAFDGALATLADRGVPIAIDDFGTGYSSLSALRRYPVDMVKIDKSFVEAIGTHDGNAMVAAIIDLSHAIGAHACAEGVETADQLTTLRDLGVDKVSGFHFGRPQAIEQLTGLHRTMSPASLPAC